MVNPICGFLRLSKGVYMPDTMEVNIPIRFVFVFLVPIDSRQDPHGVGRAFGTLMANPVRGRSLSTYAVGGRGVS